MDKNRMLDILRKELVTALGCTEPVAIALAGALARQNIQGDITAITVKASGNVIKNALSVDIPGTGMSGIDLAAALGALAGNGDKQLEVLTNITEEDITNAQAMIACGKVKVELADTSKKLYIEVIIDTENETARTIIEDTHTNVTLIEANGKVVQENICQNGMFSSEEEERKELSLECIWDFVENVDIEELEIVKESIRLNTAIGQEGLSKDYGLQVGKSIKSGVEKGILSDDLSNHAMALAAAGSDARMAGCTLPVMTNSGSGNQGISATLPVVGAAERLDVSQEKLIRATALSHLVTIYIKSMFGRLSALCGVTVSGTGAACGITYLLGGGLTEIKSAIQNNLGNVTGMVCDGAKAGCALKVSTCTSAAVQSAIMATSGITISATDGIIETSAEKTIDNFCRLGNQGTSEVDKIILDIMLNKKLV